MLGATVGVLLGLCVGSVAGVAMLGLPVGAIDGSAVIVTRIGSTIGADGRSLDGWTEGEVVGTSLVSELCIGEGISDDGPLGASAGLAEGNSDFKVDVSRVGTDDGWIEGTPDGVIDGSAVTTIKIGSSM